MSFAPALALREGDRQKLADLARLPSVPSGLAKRARIVLLAADGQLPSSGRGADRRRQRALAPPERRDGGAEQRAGASELGELGSTGRAVVVIPVLAPARIRRN